MAKYRPLSVHPKRPNRYETEDADFKPIRRKLKNATWQDRVWIFLFVFIAATMASGFLYIYLVVDSVNRHNPSMSYENITPEQARSKIMMFSLAGGIIGVVFYAVWSWADPYGTVKSEKARKARAKRRARMIREARILRDERAAQQKSDSIDDV